MGGVLSGSGEPVVDIEGGCGRQAGKKQDERDTNWAQGARPWVTGRLGDAECKKEGGTRF